MRQRDFVIPLALLAGITAFLVSQIRETRSSRPKRVVAPATSTTVAPQGVTADTTPPAQAPDTASLAAPPGDVTVQESSVRAPVIDTPYVRELIREGAPGTYLRDLLAQQENLLMRWPDRGSPMRVWIERDPPLADWNPQYPTVAEHAFEQWQQAGFPLRFDMVLDQRDVDIRIKWIDRFPPEDRQKLGMATKVRDQNGWLVSSEISVATHDSHGQPLPAELVAGIARHEIGHALGLGHSGSATDVMYPESRTPVISESDRKTLRLLYLLPPGRMP